MTPPTTQLLLALVAILAPAATPLATARAQPLQIARDPIPPTAPATSTPAVAVPFEPADRRAGGLTVPLHPIGERLRPDGLRAIGRPDDTGRMRTHISGSLAGNGRVWVGREVPQWLPLVVGTQELFLLDAVADRTPSGRPPSRDQTPSGDPPPGHLALYRDPYNKSSCALSGVENCAYTVRLYGEDQSPRWSLTLDTAGRGAQKLLSRPTHLEIQDLRLADGVLYYNEACQSYSREAGGKCSALVAVDPAGEAGPTVIWRTRPLVSNGRFVVSGDVVLAGYGFTAEPDFLSLIDRSTGKVLDRKKVASAPEQYTPAPEPGVFLVKLYDGRTVVASIRRPGPAGRPSLEVTP